MTLRINDVHSIPLIARVARVDYVAGSDVCIAHYDAITDKLTSGVLFNNSNDFSSEIHVASFKPRWASKELLYFTFFYAFKFKKWRKLFGRVSDTNIAAMDFDINLGFFVEAYLRDVFAPDNGMYILSMYDHQCRFLNMKPPKDIKFPTPDKTDIITPTQAYSWEYH